VRFWWRAEPPLWSLLLWPLEGAYRAGSSFHRALSRPAKARLPVISVGNLTVGGAGKTPVTLALAQRLLARGRKPAVLSRGYGRRSREPMQVRPDSSPRQVGDEPLLLARRGLAVFVGPSRAGLALLAAEQGADVVLLDDGLQHHALGRDLDVIVADASNPFGNGALLPRGPLREPLSALRRVSRGLVWLTRCDLPRHPRTAQLSGFPLVESAYQARADLRGKRVFLFAGIARPSRFLATVLGLGASVSGTRWFRDHHFFGASELAALRRDAGDSLLLTTEKDFVRIERPEGITALPTEMKILGGEAALDRALGEIL
jgi:tetraacyldisaccharide 4'-kinase